MSTEAAPEWLAPDDLQQLRWLAAGHYVVALLVALAACLPLIHVTLGLLILSGQWEPSGGTQPVPALVGWLFTLLPGMAAVAGWSLAGALFLAGRAIARRRRWTFCVVVDVVTAAVCMPLGTLAGVLAVVVLLRPQVKRAFGVAA
jgi:hypothetical protein